MSENISGGDTVFYDGFKTYDLGSRAHILKHLHGRIIFNPIEKAFHEDTLWSGYRAVIPFILAKNTYYISFAMRIGFITDI